MVTERTRPASCGLAAAGDSVAASLLWVLRRPQVASRTPSLGFQGSCEFPGYEISPPFADSQGCVAGCWRARGSQAPRPLPAGGQLPSGARGRRPRSFPARSLLCPRAEGPICQHIRSSVDLYTEDVYRFTAQLISKKYMTNLTARFKSDPRGNRVWARPAGDFSNTFSWAL